MGLLREWSWRPIYGKQGQTVQSHVTRHIPLPDFFGRATVCRKLNLQDKIMPDSFFASTKNRKRKRSVSTAEGAKGAKKILRKGKSSSQDTKLTNASARRGVRGAVDEELNSDRTDSEDGGIDDIDLRADVQPETSGDEDEDETPAEKRLRLAKLYLESVKDGLGEYSWTEFVF